MRIHKGTKDFNLDALKKGNKTLRRFFMSGDCFLANFKILF